MYKTESIYASIYKAGTELNSKRVNFSFTGSESLTISDTEGKQNHEEKREDFDCTNLRLNPCF